VAAKARARAGLGDAAMMPPAIAALAALPRLRHLTEQRADRRKGRFAVRAFLFGRQPFRREGTIVRFFAACCWHCCFLIFLFAGRSLPPSPLAGEGGVPRSGAPGEGLRKRRDSRALT